MITGRSVGLPTGQWDVPPALPMDMDDRPGDTPPVSTEGDGEGDAGVTASAMPPHTRGRNRTAPQVYFPPQHCTVCSLDKVFDTRTSFTQHLKTHRLFWSKRGEYVPMRRFGGQQTPSTQVVSHPTPALSSPGASAPHPVPLPRTLAEVVRPAPVPLMSIGIPANIGVLPPCRAQERAAVTSVIAFPHFPRPRPLLLDSWGDSRAGVTGASGPAAAERPSTLPTHEASSR